MTQMPAPWACAGPFKRKDKPRSLRPKCEPLSQEHAPQAQPKMADIHARVALCSGAREIDMASFFISDHDHEAPKAAPGSRPALTAVKGGKSNADQPSVLPQPAQRRHEVTPPALFVTSQPQWKAWVKGFWSWLWDMDDDLQPDTPAGALRKVKSEFNSSLWDLQSLRANQVRDMIESARSLRELWHLRAEVFKAVAVHRGQIEAQLRLDALDSHFPVRSSSTRSDSLRQPKMGKVASW